MIEFLQPVSKAVVAHRELLPKGSLGKKIDLHIDSGELPDLVGAGFAIQRCRNQNRYMYVLYTGCGSGGLIVTAKSCPGDKWKSG